MLQRSPLLRRRRRQVGLKGRSQGRKFLRRHDRLDGGLEFALGVEFLEFLQGTLQRDLLQLLLSQEHPGIGVNDLAGVFAVRGGDGEERANELFGFRRDLAPVFGVEGVLGPTDFAKEFSLVLFNEGRVAAEEDIDNDAEAPHVGLRVVGNAFENFGGHVARGAALCFQTVGAFDFLGETKVGNFDVGVALVGLSGLR